LIALGLASCQAGAIFSDRNPGSIEVAAEGNSLDQRVLVDDSLIVTFSRRLLSSSVLPENIFLILLPSSQTTLGAARAYDSSLCVADARHPAAVSVSVEEVTIDPVNDLACSRFYALCLSPNVLFDVDLPYEGRVIEFETEYCVPDLADESPVSGLVGTAITPIEFTNSGGIAESCSVDPSLPTGLSLSVVNGSCQISGTPGIDFGATQFTVTGENATGESSATVTVTVLQPDPLDPLALALASASSTTLNLSWASGGGSTTSYELARATGSTAPANCGGVTQSLGLVTTHSVTALSPGTEYSFRLCAANGNPTPDLSAGTLLQSVWTLPEDPTALVVTPASTSLGFSWTAASGAATYAIRVVAGATAPTTCLPASATTAGTASSVVALSEGTQYSYRVCGVNADGDHSLGVTGTIWTDADDIVPNASIITSTSISLSWTPSDGAVSYRVSRAAGAVAPATCAAANYTTSQTFQLDSGLSPGTQYSYRVCSVNSNGDYSSGFEISEWTYAAEPALNNITSGMSTVSIAWATASGAVTYRLSRADGDTAPADCSAPDFDSADLTQSYAALTPGSQHSFRICSVNANGDSSPGVAVTKWTLVNDPATFTMTGYAENEVSFAWTLGAGVNSGFRLAYTTGAVAPADCSSYQESFSSATTSATVSLPASGLYSFRLCARNGTDPEPDLSPGLTLTQWTLPSNMASFTATSPSTTSLQLNWSPGSAVNNGTTISRASGGTPPADCTAATFTDAFGVTSRLDSPLSAGQYSYRICAENGEGPPDVSSGNTLTRWTLPPDPTSFTLASRSATQVDLAFSSNAGENDGYRISRNIGTSAPANCSTAHASPTSAAGTYSDTALTPGTPYSYRLCARNGNTPIDLSAGLTLAGTTVWTPPQTPTLTVGLVTPNTAAITWALSGAADQIYIKWDTVPVVDCVAPNTTTDASSGSFTITGLIGGTTYHIGICAANGNTPPDVSGGDFDSFSTPAGFMAMSTVFRPEEDRALRNVGVVQDEEIFQIFSEERLYEVSWKKDDDSADLKTQGYRPSDSRRRMSSRLQSPIELFQRGDQLFEWNQLSGLVRWAAWDQKRDRWQWQQEWKVNPKRRLRDVHLQKEKHLILVYDDRAEFMKWQQVRTRPEEF
jgi:hypothetical protein